MKKLNLKLIDLIFSKEVRNLDFDVKYLEFFNVENISYFLLNKEPSFKKAIRGIPQPSVCKIYCNPGVGELFPVNGCVVNTLGFMVRWSQWQILTPTLWCQCRHTHCVTE
jgi:hypothetical protein